MSMDRIRMLGIVCITALGIAYFAWMAAVMPRPAEKGKPASEPPAAAPAPTPVAVASTTPTPTASESSPPRLRIGQRLLAKLLRHRVTTQLQHDGFALSGGNPTPLTAEQADRLLSRLDDAEIVGVAESSGVAGDAVVAGDGGRLGALLKWIADHKTEILEVIKLIITILAIFADTPS